MALGLQRARTVLVEMGNLRPFSDVEGLCVVRIGNSKEARETLVDRLRNAGCKAKTRGRRAWLSVDFDAAANDPDGVKSDWVLSHPAKDFGPVWIRVIARDEYRSLEHKYVIKWGPWLYEGTLDLRKSNIVTLLHQKKNDGLSVPIDFHVSYPCLVGVGHGHPRDAREIVDIKNGWRRID